MTRVEPTGAAAHLATNGRTKRFVALRHTTMLASMLAFGCAVHQAPTGSPVREPPSKGSASPAPSSTPARPPPLPLPSNLHLPMWTEHALPQDARLLHAKTGIVPLAHVRLVISAGQADDGLQPGLAVVTSAAILHGLFGPDAPRRRAAGLEQYGAHLAVHVLAHHTIFALEVPERSAAAAVALLLDEVRLPALRTAALGRAREHAEQGLNLAASSDPAATARAALLQQGLATASESVGTGASDVSAIKDWHCRRFHREHYGPKGLTIVATSSGDASELLPAASKSIDGWSASPKAPAPASVDNPSSARLLLLDTRLAATRSSIALAPAEAPAETWPAAWLAVQLAGQTPHEEEMDLDPSCGLTAQPGPEWPVPSRLVACGTTPTPLVARHVALLRENLAGLAAQPPPAASLVRAANALVDRLSIRLSSPRALADAMTNTVLLELPPDTLRSLAEQLHAATPDEVQVAARHWIAAGGPSIVVAGPRAQLEAETLQPNAMPRSRNSSTNPSW